jgi:ABC-2 type transport system ATP-binding protein
MDRPRIEVLSLGKSYGPVNALVNVSLHAGLGMVLGILGHNGAGKTTLVDILATRQKPTTGTARVCGWDVTTAGHRVRQHIGLTSQYAAVDEGLSGQENLVLLSRLLGANARQAKARATELIELFMLTDAANRKAATYSGGMRRRLDLAASLLARPEVLFLDEPTTGLDPVSRTAVWGFIEHMADNYGTTVVLTTQYLEEADRLARHVVVLAAGHLVASGSPEQLKASIGQRTATVTLPSMQATYTAAAVLTRYRMGPVPNGPLCTVTVPISAPGDIAAVVRILDSIGVGIADLKVTEPTLDDVYMALHNAGWQTDDFQTSA